MCMCKIHIYILPGYPLPSTINLSFIKLPADHPWYRQEANWLLTLPLRPEVVLLVTAWAVWFIQRWLGSIFTSSKPFPPLNHPPLSSPLCRGFSWNIVSALFWPYFGLVLRGSCQHYLGLILIHLSLQGVLLNIESLMRNSVVTQGKHHNWWVYLGERCNFWWWTISHYFGAWKQAGNKARIRIRSK